MAAAPARRARRHTRPARATDAAHPRPTHRGEVGRGEYLALLIAEIPAANDRPRALDRRANAERSQHADTIRLDRGHGHSGAPRVTALYELRREATRVKRGGDRKATDSAADNQDA